MLGRRPWWSFMLVAIMVVIRLLGPLHGGIGLRAYQSDMVEPVSS